MCIIVFKLGSRALIIPIKDAQEEMILFRLSFCRSFFRLTLWNLSRLLQREIELKNFDGCFGGAGYCIYIKYERTEKT